MEIITCKSTCPICRECETHMINRPNSKVRLQKFLNFKPELGRECPGFIEVFVDDDADTDTH